MIALPTLVSWVCDGAPSNGTEINFSYAAARRPCRSGSVHGLACGRTEGRVRDRSQNAAGIRCSTQILQALLVSIVWGLRVAARLDGSLRKTAMRTWFGSILFVVLATFAVASGCGSKPDVINHGGDLDASVGGSSTGGGTG